MFGRRSPRAPRSTLWRAFPSFASPYSISPAFPPLSRSLGFGMSVPLHQTHQNLVPRTGKSHAGRKPNAAWHARPWRQRQPPPPPPCLVTQGYFPSASLWFKCSEAQQSARRLRNASFAFPIHYISDHPPMTAIS